MKLKLDPGKAINLVSWPQKIRVMTECWIAENVYCPACGAAQVSCYANNRPVADFFCADCAEDFELKSKRGQHGNSIPDGAYRTMIDRIGSAHNPNFFLLRYDRARWEVTDLEIIPKHYFVPAIIASRPALGPGARRAGWVGCNILINLIPKSGRISLVESGRMLPKADVLKAWKATLFLRTEAAAASKGWLLNVMWCIERLDKPSFTLADLYGFEHDLGGLHPGNRNVRAKIRQQLQFLRDKHYLDFEGRGTYRLR